jgi:hypothetical protein
MKMLNSSCPAVDADEGRFYSLVKFFNNYQNVIYSVSDSIYRAAILLPRTIWCPWYSSFLFPLLLPFKETRLLLQTTLSIKMEE